MNYSKEAFIAIFCTKYTGKLLFVIICFSNAYRCPMICLHQFFINHLIIFQFVSPPVTQIYSYLPSIP
nr:MAG TPA: hypothetical protein [Caudoviricetes sp.]